MGCRRQGGSFGWSLSLPDRADRKENRPQTCGNQANDWLAILSKDID
jgi:hypothetical protein